MWRSLGASYVRKALRDNLLDRDPAWNARLDSISARHDASSHDPAMVRKQSVLHVLEGSQARKAAAAY